MLRKTFFSSTCSFLFLAFSLSLSRVSFAAFLVRINFSSLPCCQLIYISLVFQPLSFSVPRASALTSSHVSPRLSLLFPSFGVFPLFGWSQSLLASIVIRRLQLVLSAAITLKHFICAARHYYRLVVFYFIRQRWFSPSPIFFAVSPSSVLLFSAFSLLFLSTLSSLALVSPSCPPLSATLAPYSREHRTTALLLFVCSSLVTYLPPLCLLQLVIQDREAAVCHVFPTLSHPHLHSLSFHPRSYSPYTPLSSFSFRLQWHSCLSSFIL